VYLTAQCSLTALSIGWEKNKASFCSCHMQQQQQQQKKLIPQTTYKLKYMSSIIVFQCWVPVAHPCYSTYLGGPQFKAGPDK
jgi:hypothetical protein